MIKFNLVHFLLLSSVIGQIVMGKMAICSYESNVDYLSSIDILYVFARAPESCCQLCSFKPECVGK